MSIFLNYFKKEKNKVLIQSSQNINIISSKLKKDKIAREFYSIINFITFYLILFLLPEQALSDNYIEIKVNHQGEQQVLSDEFKGVLPKNFVGKRIQVDSLSSTIKLEWDINITNFSHMFSNLKNITEVHIHNLLGLNMSFSYTFSNCKI